MLAQIFKGVQSYYLGQIWALGPLAAHPETKEIELVFCLLEYQVQLLNISKDHSAPSWKGMSAAVLGSEIAVSCESQLLLLIPGPEERA